MIDIHNHIIYGIDDGSKTLEDSIKLIEALIADGFTGAITTSHYRPELYKYDLKEYISNFNNVKEQLSSRNIKFELLLGNEAYLSEHLLQDLLDGKCLTLAESRYVLIEIISIIDLSITKKMLADLALNGFTPIIAHCERLVETKKDLANLLELKQMGFYLQVNASALLKSKRKWLVKWIYKNIENGTISFIASDAHDVLRRPPRAKQIYDLMKKKYGSLITEKVFHDNQQKIIRDETIGG